MARTQTYTTPLTNRDFGGNGYCELQIVYRGQHVTWKGADSITLMDAAVARLGKVIARKPDEIGTLYRFQSGAEGYLI